MIIGVYDYDFMNYAPVIPNLECMKYCAYYKRKRDITVLAPKLEPARYSTLIVRKDYEDGKYPSELSLPNVIYGGAAFTNNNYVPLDPSIERMKPDISGYERYDKAFKTVDEKILFRTFMKSTHIRLSLDGKTLWKDYTKSIYTPKDDGLVILHDFDLNKIKDSDLAVRDLCEYYNKTNGEFRARRVGMKFPTNLYTSEDLERWNFLAPNLALFNIIYHGIINDEQLMRLSEDNPLFISRIEYDVTPQPFDLNHFIMVDLPRIYLQLYFLRRAKIKILLKYDAKLLKDRRLENLVHLFRNWGQSDTPDASSWTANTLYHYMYSDAYKRGEQFKNVIPLQDIRDSFQYIREVNYELFRLFYEIRGVELKKGEFQAL